MSQILVIQDSLLNGYLNDTLDISSVIALFLGIAVLVNKNPITSLIYLIGLFASISIYLILIGLTFIGFSYLIVYIGAVSILFLFILMLINIRTSELQSNNWNSLPLGIFITILLNYILFQTLPYYTAILNSYNNKLNSLLYFSLNFNEYNNIIIKYINEKINTITDIMYVTTGSWDDNIVEISHISAIGNLLYTTYNMWLFIASFILLLAMVGAIIITIKQPSSNEKN